MTPAGGTDTPAASGEPAQEVSGEEPAREPQREAEWQRRRRLAAVFGDDVPEQTSDDRDSREDLGGKGDDWYRDQVPPHHG